MSELTRVAFRQFDDGEVIALFPDVPWTWNPNDGMITSYMHNGQHDGASIELLDELEQPTPTDITPLYLELLRIGYDLKMSDEHYKGRA